MGNLLSTRTLRSHGKALGAAVLAIAALAVLGFAAYKYLFSRPGEAAVGLIAADADVVVSLDTNPSERQLAVFKEITDSLQREGIAQKLDEAITGMLQGTPVGKDIRPHLQHSFALGMWMKEGKEPEVVTLLAIDDPGAVRSSLERYGQKKSEGIFAIDNAPGPLSATVVDRYLAVSNSESALARVEKVRSGSEASVAKVEEFVEARKALPEDANLMVFVSPKVWKTFEKQAGGFGGFSAMNTTKWMAYGATIVPEGLAFDYQCPMDSSKMGSLKQLGSIAEFDLDSLKRLPEGAYGVFGYSQGGRYWGMMRDSIGDVPELQKEMNEGIAKFEKESGLSIDNDIVPALEGEQIFAVYPGASGKPEDVDAVAVLTDANGANPAALAAKLKELAIRKASEQHEVLSFTESKIGEHTVWEMDGTSRQKMMDGFSSANPFAGARPVPQALPPSPEGMAMSPEQQRFYEEYEAERKRFMAQQKEPTPPPFLASKTLVYAQVGNSVVFASSKAILARALEADASGRSLANDPAIAAMRPHVAAGSQCLMLVNLQRIMKALEPGMKKGLEGAPIDVSDLVGLFGDGLVGLVASGKFDGQVAVGRLLMPLDFERGIAMIGDSMNTKPNAHNHETGSIEMR